VCELVCVLGGLAFVPCIMDALERNDTKTLKEYASNVMCVYMFMYMYDHTFICACIPYIHTCTGPILG
jgi:hypothetical protein